MASNDVVLRIKDLASQGLSQREIGERAGLSRSTVNGLLKGHHGISAKRSRQVTENLDRASIDYTVRVFDERGKLVEVDPINKRERAKAREWLDNFPKYGRNQVPLQKLQGFKIKVATRNGVRLFRPASDKETLRRIFESGEAREIRYWREKGSP